MSDRTTIFSPCRKYRYTLWREWDATLPYCQFIGLNPSTADEVQDDPTIRRCIAFAKQWGFGALCMTNLFAWRDTLPENMKRAAEPVGAENDHWLETVGRGGGLVVAAWGNHGTHNARASRVKINMADAEVPLKCFRLTKSGQPEHPLYQPSDRALIEYTALPAKRLGVQPAEL